MKTPIILFVLSTGVHAAVSAIGSSGANSATFSGAVLQSVTANGVNFNTSSLIRIGLTGYQGSNNDSLLNITGASTTISASQRRALIETDWRADTGIANVASSGADKLTGTFNSPVVNRTGIDVFIFELGGNDAMSFNVNGGNSITWQSGEFGTALTSVTTDVLKMRNAANDGDLSGSTPDLDTLLSNAVRIQTTSTQDIKAVGIDLSDLGIADGASVSSFGISGGGSDPVIIAALPMPIPELSSALLGTLGALALLRRRR